MPSNRLVSLVLIAALSGCGGGGATIGSGGTVPAGGGSGTLPPGGSPAPGAAASPTPASASSASPSTTASPIASSGSGAVAVPFPGATDADAFYAQPKSFANAAPGTLLGSRSITYEPDGVSMTNAAWQLKFVSRDQNGNPVAAVATVVKPLTPPLGTPDLLVEEFAEDGLGAQCAPSHSVTGSTTDSNADLETGVPSAGLAAGWTLVYPDYEGPNSEYAVGRNAGQITLDSIRAAEQYAPLGLSVKTPVGINGYSGGAIAASWTATLEKTYAPELDIVGIASGGTPANIPGIISNIDSDVVSNQLFFDVIFMAGIGINRGYPQFLTPVLDAAGIAAATSIENGCVGNKSDGSSGPTGTFAGFTASGYTSTPGFISGAAADGLAQPNEPPTTNVFVYHSLTDELIPIAGADSMVSTWCGEGAKVGYYREVAGGDHITTELDSVPFVILYLTSVFGGTTPALPPTTTTCNE